MGMKHLRRQTEQFKAYRAETKGETPEQSRNIRKALKKKKEEKVNLKEV